MKHHPDGGVGQVDEEHAGALVRLRHHDPDLCAVGPGDERLATVDHPVVAILATGRQHHRGIRAGTALRGGLRHEEGRACITLDHRLKKARLELGTADLAEQVHIAFVRCGGVAGERPQRREARPLEHDRRLALRKMRAVGQDMRREYTSRTRLFLELGNQVFGWAVVMVTPRVPLIGNDDIANERLHPCRDVGRASRICRRHG